MKTKLFRQMRDMYASKTEPEQARALALLVWEVVLGAVAIGAIAIIAYASWEFVGVLRILNSPHGNVSNPPIILNRGNLTRFIESVDTRKTGFQAVLSGHTVYQDPAK